jgi:hypothetical protein
MRSVNSACAMTVLRTSRVCTSEMPMLLPMLRTRLKRAVPCARISGLKVAKVAALNGTNTNPTPIPWITPGHTMSLGRQLQRIMRHLPQSERGYREAQEQHQAQIDLADEAPHDEHREHGAEAGWGGHQPGSRHRIVEQRLEHGRQERAGGVEHQTDDEYEQNPVT